MRFSICMPTMGERDISPSVQSVLDQTFKDFELIIKNGGKTKPIFPEDPRIVYIQKEDKGIADAMNQAIEVARGEILNESNDDDFMLPNALKIVNDEIGEYPWCFGQCLVGMGAVGGDWQLKDLLESNIVPQPAGFWKKEAGEGMLWDTEHDYAADWDWWLQLAHRYEHKFICKPLANYIVHPGQISEKFIKKQVEHARGVQEKWHI